jgi:phage tail-like protein
MYPPAAFRFRVLFRELDDPHGEDSHFQSISGLEANMQNDSADQNKTDNLTHTPSLVLTRAVKSQQVSALSRWLFAHFNKNKNAASLPEAHIELLDETNEPYMVWVVRGLHPKSWKLHELHAEKSGVLMETIELYYKEILFPAAGQTKQE